MTRASKQQNPPADVAAIFADYPARLRGKLRQLRKLILDTADTTQGVGRIEETLKWGQPSYLTVAPKSGSTIRIDRLKSSNDQYAIYFNCQTDLVATFRELYPGQFRFEGNRAIIFNVKDELPKAELTHCIALALTYHARKRKGAA